MAREEQASERLRATAAREKETNAKLDAAVRGAEGRAKQMSADLGAANARVIGSQATEHAPVAARPPAGGGRCGGGLA